MDPQILKGGINIAAFLMVSGGLLLLFQERGTAEFIITTFVVIIGLVFALGLTLVATISRKQ